MKPAVLAINDAASLLQLCALLYPGGDTLHFEALSALLGVAGVLSENAQRDRLGLCIAVLHQIEWVAECAAERRLGAEGKWSVLLALEAAKAGLRLASVARSGRLLVGDVSPSGLAALTELELVATGRAEQLLRALAAFRRRRASASGYSLPPLPPPPCPPLSPRRLRAQLRAGEALRAVRPVLYCAAVRRLGRGAWTPWLLALTLDLGSLALLRRTPCNPEEEEELARRRACLALYALFGPPYAAGVQPRLRALSDSCATLPFLRLIADKGREVLDSAATTHTLTSSL